MDQLKIQNHQQSKLSNKSQICQFLNTKISKASQTTDEDSQMSTRQNNQKRKLIPNYSFRFGQHHIGESVEYEVELIETFKIFGRTITQKYKFKTQYSKLEKLSQKLKSNNFPCKKWFGNKDPQFIEKRKKQLSSYLNKIAIQKSKIFYQFVIQIKQATLLAQQKKVFRI